MVESGSPCEREKSECRETGGVTFREALGHRPPPGAGRRPGLHAPLGPGGSGLPTPGSQTSGPRNWEKPHSWAQGGPSHGCGQEDVRCAEGARLPGGPALGAHPSLLQAADSRPAPFGFTQRVMVWPPLHLPGGPGTPPGHGAALSPSPQGARPTCPEATSPPLSSLRVCRTPKPAGLSPRCALARQPRGRPCPHPGLHPSSHLLSPSPTPPECKAESDGGVASKGHQGGPDGSQPPRPPSVLCEPLSSPLLRALSSQRALMGEGWQAVCTGVPQRKKSGQGWGPRTRREQKPSEPERGVPVAPDLAGSLPLSPQSRSPPSHTCAARGERVGRKRGGRRGAGSSTSRVWGTLGEESAGVGCNEAPAVGQGAASVSESETEQRVTQQPHSGGDAPKGRREGLPQVGATHVQSSVSHRIRRGAWPESRASWRSPRACTQWNIAQPYKGRKF